MKHLAAAALLCILTAPAAAQTNWGWGEFYAQQRNQELARISSELSWMNHQRTLDNIRSGYGGGYYRTRGYYRTNYYPTYQQSIQRAYNPYGYLNNIYGSQFRTRRY